MSVRCDLQQYLHVLSINKQYQNRQTFRISMLMFMSNMSDLITQIASAMKFAHDKTVIHGDLKSENILLSISHEGGLQAMVCDWGSGNEKTGEYYFDYDPKSHLESNVTCNDIIKAQDVYAFIRTLKVDCFINIYGLLKGSVRKVLPSSFLLKNLLEIDDVKKMVELAFHNGIPRKLGTFNDLIQSIKKLNSIDKENMSSTLGRIEELLTTQLQMLDSEVVRKEWLTLAEYYWRIKADLDPESLNHAVQGVSEWLVESDKNAYVVGVKQSIEEYQSNLTFSFFSCFRGKIGRERADRLQQVIANLKTVPGVQKSVENTYKSYRGFLPGSLKSFLTNHQSSSQSAVSSCSYN